MIEVVTIGIKYQDTLENFVKVLHENEVTHLMDVRYLRHLPSSLPSRFSVYEKLYPALTDAHIFYSWRNVLALSNDMRDQWVADKSNLPTQAELLELYRNKMLADGVLLNGLREIVSHNKKTAIMCDCNLDEEVFCHRRLIAMLVDSPECQDLVY